MGIFSSLKATGQWAVDCDTHPEVPNTEALLPYIDGHWGDLLMLREMKDFQTYNFPPKVPLSARKDWRPKEGKPAGSLEQVRSELLDAFGLDIAICTPLFGLQLILTEDLASVLATAVNDFVSKEWLDKEPRLRASIVVASQNPRRAAEEIERRAGDKRFVQVLMLVSNDMPLGKSFYWPIYEAAARNNLPVAIHAGSTFRHPLTPAGPTAYYYEDYFSQSLAFQGQLVSLVVEGVFAKFPDLRVILSECGVTWIPAILNRVDKFWQGTRTEIPWITRLPSEIVKQHIRVTLQPFDAPDCADTVERILDHIKSDEFILFSTDYPHWQFDGNRIVPPGFSDDMIRRIAIDNPKQTYTRLQ